MATIKGIEVSSQTYDLEDETGRSASSDNATAIGTLANLDTTAKTDLVSAINEVADTASGNYEKIGTLADLDTTAKTDLVSAINEVARGIGEVPRVTAPSHYNDIDHDIVFAEDDSKIFSTADIRAQLKAFGGDLVDGRTYTILAVRSIGSVWNIGAFTYSETDGWSSANSISGTVDMMSAGRNGITFSKSGSTEITVRPIIIG